ncbi:hypothetical protein D3C85_1170890 [compost metagenome]
MTQPAEGADQPFMRNQSDRMSQLGKGDQSSEGGLTDLAHTVTASVGRERTVEMSSDYAQRDRLDQVIAETIPKAHGLLALRGEAWEGFAWRWRCREEQALLLARWQNRCGC